MFNQKNIYYTTLCLLIFSDAANVVTPQQLPQSEDHLHPVRQELVDEIKAKTKTWKPREIKDNHFRGKTAKEIRDGTIGNLDQGMP